MKSGGINKKKKKKSHGIHLQRSHPKYNQHSTSAHNLVFQSLDVILQQFLFYAISKMFTHHWIPQSFCQVQFNSNSLLYQLEENYIIQLFLFQISINDWPTSISIFLDDPSMMKSLGFLKRNWCHCALYEISNRLTL